MQTEEIKIPKRITATLLGALTAGVVPRVGLEYINVGRKTEISAFLKDLEGVGEGAGACRFIVGKYGSGKSFLLQLVRSWAMEKGFVVADCDLSPERRFTGTKGQGLATYKELMQNLSTKTRPDGGALGLLLERWLSSLQAEAAAADTSASEEALLQALRKRVFEVAGSMEDMVYGFDFGKIINLYLEGFCTQDEEKKSAALKWLRGEYSTKTEAKAACGVSVIISDENWYEYLKLMAAFVRRAGYTGLVVLVDELVNLFKIPQSVTRQNNYEKILTIFNDTMQGKAKHIAFFMGGTPQFIDDNRKGLFSYEALRSRLDQSRFTQGQYKDMLSPVIRLQPLTNEEIYLLCENIERVHRQQYGYEPFLQKEEYVAFMNAELSRIGADQNITPREITRDFIEILNILYQNPQLRIKDVLSDSFSFSQPEVEGEQIDAAFAEFSL